MAKAWQQRLLLSDSGWALLPFLFLISSRMLLRASGLIHPTLLRSLLNVPEVSWHRLTEDQVPGNIGILVPRFQSAML